MLSIARAHMQAEGSLRSALEKRRLVHRLTLTRHEVHFRREIGIEVLGAGLVLAGLTACRAVWPDGIMTAAFSHLANAVALTCSHLILHTTVITVGYRLVLLESYPHAHLDRVLTRNKKTQGLCKAWNCGSLYLWSHSYSLVLPIVCPSTSIPLRNQRGMDTVFDLLLCQSEDGH